MCQIFLRPQFKILFSYVAFLCCSQLWKKSVFMLHSARLWISRLLWSQSSPLSLASLIHILLEKHWPIWSKIIWLTYEVNTKLYKKKQDKTDKTKTRQFHKQTTLQGWEITLSSSLFRSCHSLSKELIALVALYLTLINMACKPLIKAGFVGD